MSGYLISEDDARRLAEALRWIEQQKANTYRNLSRRRAAVGIGGGTSIRKAYCLTAGGVGNTINCTLDLDASEAAAWASHIIYSEGDQVAHNNKIWQSLIDDNQGNEPGVDDGWVNIQVVVFCSVIGEAGLADCFPTLSAGTMMPVWYDNRDGKWRSLWWFQAHEPCPEELI